MKKFTGRYTTSTAKALKGSERILCQVSEDGTIYICNGFLLCTMNAPEYAATVQPLTCCEPGAWTFDKDGKHEDEAHKLDLVKLFADTVRTAADAEPLARAPFTVQAKKAPAARYYEINEETARNAHYCVHMSDYKPGSATAEYRRAVDKAAALVEAKKARVSPFYHDKLDALLDRYARRLAQWMNDYNRNQASYPSQFISGAGGYNMRKHEKQMSREGTLWNEYDEIKAILNKIEAVGSGPVDLADPHAREMLADQLQKLQNKLDESKALNAYYRKHKSFDGFPGMSAEAAAKLTASFADTKERCPWVKSPVPDYELTSLRGKIKRVQARLDELDKRAQQAEQPADGTKFPGGEIVRNLEADRLQILFDEKPDEDTRAALKQNGFRWSPRYSAWQRQLTPNAEAAARRALGLTE